MKTETDQLPPSATVKYSAAVYAGDALTSVCLGWVLAPSRRLGLRWLRAQAYRFADALDPYPPRTRWAPATLLHPVDLPVPDAPTELRTWADDDECQDSALRTLAAGHRFDFIARDQTCWYGLTAHPLVMQPLCPRPGALVTA
ncbi:hypothetical protein [Streptomyces atratus]|uniref:hypothetical protein n=1 Tax=Streptomyces atratus TaxID=1893 RepID=UPI00364F0E03